MKVRKQMSREVVVVSPDATVGEARRRLQESGLRCLPVTQGGRLLGLVLGADPAVIQAPEEATVASVMRLHGVRIHPGAPIERAALLMLEHDVRGLPVVESDDTLVGVLTVSDLLRTMVESPPIVLW